MNALSSKTPVCTPTPVECHQGCGAKHHEHPLSDLADHIIAHHHAFMRRQMRKISELMERVGQEGGPCECDLPALRALFEPFSREVEMHMNQEEQITFPLIRQLERCSAGEARGYGGELEGWSRQLRHDHDLAMHVLGVMRKLCDNYHVPVDSGAAYREMIDAMLDLERDMHQHTHEEDDVLFPRARAIHDSLLAKRCSAPRRHQ